MERSVVKDAVCFCAALIMICPRETKGRSEHAVVKQEEEQCGEGSP